MAATAGRGSYAKSAGVRRRILEVCADAFGETGFHGASTKDIAQRAGISHTGLRHHFPRKEDLLAAVLDLRDERGTAFLRSADAVDPDAFPVEALRGMLDLVVDHELQPGLMQLHCVLSAEATAADHPAHAYYAERHRQLRAFYARAYTALARGGQLRSAVDPETLAVMTVSLVKGIQEQWLFDRETVRIEYALRMFLASVVPELGDESGR
ncbi:TetR/AcrR family transcriptional regulator [Yinghuangia sp. ASG 101]|uniref:TetR/AcrR family transcriptional regulator n=1 Tax=Yinghuangia sp. ASG 101 TaxID=2896848 RepID=UPI001E458B8D|nr:TetR/AcrR family transcriptional regulator [Yinghuangia sp. ASG 101]UGQ11691.1 TetR/AcrR family transcriptional regulator [Yinghuangia sp. ASG 101]